MPDLKKRDTSQLEKLVGLIGGIVEFPERMLIRHPIFLMDGEERLPLPDWSKALLWLGWWCRSFQPNRSRILAVAVLPVRSYASAFAGLGCLMAGAMLCRGGFSWDDLKSLPLGHEIFWKTAGNGVRYQGVILQPSEGAPDLVPVRITATRRSKEIGLVWSFSPAKFSECLFSEECLPTENGTAAINNALRFYRDAGLETDSRWLYSSGAEALIMTNQSSFWDAVDGLQIAVRKEGAIPLRDALCVASIHDRGVAKLRLSPANRMPGPICSPVTILDGASAWDQMTYANSGNVLLLLDRTEFTVDIRNFLLDVANYADEPTAEMKLNIPDRLPPGIELTAFVLGEN